MIARAAPRRLERTAVRAAVAVLLLGGATVLQLLRQQGAPSWETIWAEDGTIYLQAAILDGGIGTVVQDYAGYLQVLPRLIALGVAELPLEHAAAAFAVGSALLSSLVAGFVYLASVEVTRSEPIRLALAATVVLLPEWGAEVVANAANLHWYALVACFWALVWQAETPGRLALRTVVVALAVLSDPLAALFLPLALVGPYRRRTLRSAVPALVLAAGTILQLFTALTADDHVEITDDMPVSALPGAFALRVVGSLVLGLELVDNAWFALGRLFTYGALLLVAGLLAWGAAKAERKTRRFIALCAGYAVVVFTIELMLRGAPLTHAIPDEYYRDGSRYFTLPISLLAFALILAVHTLDRRRPYRGFWRPQTVFFLAAGIVVASSLTLQNFRSNGPRWKPEVAVARAACAGASPESFRTIPIVPQPTWLVRVRCRDIG